MRRVLNLCVTVAVAALAGAMTSLVLPSSVVTLQSHSPKIELIEKSDQTSSNTTIAGAAADSSQSIETSHEVATLREAIASLKDDLETLNAQVVSLLDTVSTLPVSVDAVNASEQDEQFLKNPSNMADHLAQIDAENDQYLLEIENTLFSQQTDSRWSYEVSFTLEEALRSEALPETAVVDIDCRFTLCRLEVEHDNLHDSALFQTSFAGLIADTGLHPAIAQTKQSESWLNTVLYLNREGFSLTPQP